MDPDPVSARLARRRIEEAGGRFIEGVTDVLSAAERFHVVCAFEVLEHLDDDIAALRSWVARLVPGGMLVLSVPAFQSRFAAWDVMAGHVRRYDPELLRARLQEVGLIDVEIWVTGFPFGVLLEHGRNILATLRPKAGTTESRTLASGRVYQPPAIVGWATAAITLPFRWIQRPFGHTKLGTGLVARAIRPERVLIS